MNQSLLVALTNRCWLLLLLVALRCHCWLLLVIVTCRHCSIAVAGRC